MPALSIRQPFAWAILYAGKRLENRSRKDGRMPDVCRHRGPLLIHASAGCTRDEFADGADAIRDATGGELHMGCADFVRYAALQRGGIVGRCTVVGHVEPTGATRRSPHYERHGFDEPIDGLTSLSDAIDFRWHVFNSYALVLADVEPLPFVPWKGALGLFDVDETKLAEAEAMAVFEATRASRARANAAGMGR